MNKAGMAKAGRHRSFDRDAALLRAMEVFWEHGYEGASLGELKAAMGINAPSLYAAFGSKEALFREAIALYDATEGEVTAKALQGEPTTRAAVEAMLRNNVVAYTHPEKPTGCMIVLSATTYTPEHEGIRDFLAQNRLDACAVLEQRLKKGIAAGELPAKTNTAALAGFYTSVLQGLSIQARDGVSRERLNAVVDVAMAAWGIASDFRHAGSFQQGALKLQVVQVLKLVVAGTTKGSKSPVLCSISIACMLTVDEIT